MDWSVAQEATLRKGSQASRSRPELIIVARGYLQAFFVCECNQPSSLVLVNGERLLNIDVTSAFQATSSNFEMTLRRRRNVDNVWPGFIQELVQVVKATLARKSLVKLSRHQWFLIADTNNLASRNPSNLGGMGIRDLSASDNGDPKHFVFGSYTLQNNV